jgi:hypothetical protein
MTGQVKEDVLARYMELGVSIQAGALGFTLDGFDQSECLTSASAFNYFDLNGNHASVEIPRGGFGFTICQVPVVYCPGDSDEAPGPRRINAIPPQLEANPIFRRSGRAPSIKP